MRVISVEMNVAARAMRDVAPFWNGPYHGACCRNCSALPTPLCPCGPTATHGLRHCDRRGWSQSEGVPDDDGSARDDGNVAEETATTRERREEDREMGELRK